MHVLQTVIVIFPRRTNTDPSPEVIAYVALFFNTRINASIAAGQKFFPFKATYE